MYLQKHRLPQKYLHKEAFIFSAELSAINLALDLISESDQTKFIIFSDSVNLHQFKNRK